MDEKKSNPFTPVFGQIPLHMAGREDILEEMDEAFASNGQDPNLTSIIVGTRGTGKTALLSLLSKEAESQGWVAVNVTALPGMLENVYEQAVKHCAHLIDSSSTKTHLTGITVGGFGVEWTNSQPAQGTWRTRMEALLDLLAPTGAGLLICVDEVDPELDEMAELAATYQHFLRDGRKVSLLMAGIPSHVLSLLSSKESSFLRRACQHRLGRLANYEVEQAFESTMADGGKTLDNDALELAVKNIDGFPFMIQLLGYRCWNVAGKKSNLTIEDIQKGTVRAQRELRERVYDTVYQELSQGDRDFLVAMLEDKEKSALSDLRERLGKNPQQLSYQKKRLISQGLVRDENRGFVAFDMPGLREYLADQL